MAVSVFAKSLFAILNESSHVPVNIGIVQSVSFISSLLAPVKAVVNTVNELNSPLRIFSWLEEETTVQIIQTIQVGNIRNSRRLVCVDVKIWKI